MNTLDFYLEKIQEYKLKCIKSQDYESAVYCRDAERSLIKVIECEDTLTHFLKYIKSREYGNYNKIYDIIKNLDRKAKILKIEKLH